MDSVPTAPATGQSAGSAPPRPFATASAFPSPVATMMTCRDLRTAGSVNVEQVDVIVKALDALPDDRVVTSPDGLRAVRIRGNTCGGTRGQHRAHPDLLRQLDRGGVQPIGPVEREHEQADFDRAAALFPTVSFTWWPCDEVTYGDIHAMIPHITVSTMDRLVLPELLRFLITELGTDELAQLISYRGQQ